MRTTKQKFRNNPIYFTNDRTQSLEEAYKLFIDTFEEYATKNNLNEEQISNFKEQILTVYLEKKASYFFETKLFEFSDYFRKSISFALTKSFDETDNKNITKLFYYNNKHRLVSHEQY
ncbi:MAG: hypothetical protein Q8N83_12830 [Ignavibacteria bacterium]|nr:hypothetical protein [Ignavibacteria bacterium]